MDLVNCLKNIVKETYMNVCEENTHKYKKMKEVDFLQVAENIVGNEEFWNNLDFLILNELNTNYERK